MKRIVILLVAGLIILSASFAHAADDPSAARPAPAKNPVVHWELACHDSEKSATFFKNVFEWEIAMVPNTIIHGCRTTGEDGGIDGGIFTLSRAKLPFLTIYIEVTEIEKKAEMIKENGGLVHEDPHEIFPGIWICLFNDPSGVTFAMLEHRPAEK